MKKILLAISLAILAGCASGPTKIRVKNCEELMVPAVVGQDRIWECEEIPERPEREFGRRI